MQIEVVIVGWEQGCCGKPFALGGPATWPLQAIAPEPGTLPRFVADSHDQIPPDVPHWRVTGTVVAITGISYPRILVPGMAGTYTGDTSAPQPHELSAVGARPEDNFSEYWVVLEVPDGTDLPAHMLGAEKTAQLDREARTTQRNRQRMTDEVGLLLEALADDAQRRYADLARAIRATDKSALTLEPHRTDAAAISWSRSSDEGNDGITVQVGDGRWRFPASPDDAALVRVFLDAAVTGSVEEHVRPAGAPQRLETEVLATDGRSWTATIEFRPFAAGGVVAMPGLLWARVQRGEHRYGPWTSS
ncbi:hypothetical protein E3O42_09785 [Cryobacterium adonitolivorans]|uniref:Uncharacterized protein n=1 Tax=Cryobacterium adonitolivorans TaxID=1259189 RepID=A0A4R8W7A8_9MICO|nr:DUF6578 domain-containing protein [Cryobacterium adonitolivorans]TFC01653.1 hypothetical protein E3O42_09785 [Cryobacterium adonitolivorans]